MDRTYWARHIARLDPVTEYEQIYRIIATVLEHGLASEPGRTAIRRMNQMHGAYPISNDDKLYVLCAFVVMPIRWIDGYGWRPLSELEKTASANYYRALGKLVGIKDIPATHQDFAASLDRNGPWPPARCACAADLSSYNARNGRHFP